MDKEMKDLPENNCKDTEDTLLEFPYWLALFGLLTYHVDRESAKIRDEQKDGRRDALKSGNMQAY